MNDRSSSPRPSRYEWSHAQWARIEQLLPGKVNDPGRTAVDNRPFVNAVLWVLRSGARWNDLPSRCGAYKSVHKQFMRWAEKESVAALGRHVQSRSGQRVRDDRQPGRQSPCAGGQWKKGGRRIRLWGAPEEV